MATMKPAGGLQENGSVSATTTAQTQTMIPDIQFSISPAIFIPFPGLTPSTTSTIPGTPQTLDPPQKLRLILKYIREEQNAVKSTTISMYNAHFSDLISKANVEIVGIKEREKEGLKRDEDEEKEMENVKRVNEEVMKRAFVRDVGGGGGGGRKGADFEWKGEDIWGVGGTKDGGVDGMGDTVMGGMGGGAQIPGLGMGMKKRTETVVREEMLGILMEKHENAMRDLNGYESHSRGVVKQYEDSLNRWLTRENGGVGVGVGSDVFARLGPPGRYGSLDSGAIPALGRTGGGVRFGSGDASAGAGFGGLQRPGVRFGSGDATNNAGSMGGSRSAGGVSPSVRFATDDSPSVRFGGESPLSAGVLPKGGGVRFVEPDKPSGAGGVKKGGILKNKGVMSPVNREAMGGSETMDLDRDGLRRGSR